MEMLNANGTKNKLRIKMSQDEVTEYVVRKYKNLDIHPVNERRGKNHETEQK